MPSTHFDSLSSDKQLFEIQQYIEAYFKQHKAPLRYNDLPELYKSTLIKMPNASISSMQTSDHNWNILHTVAYNGDPILQNIVCQKLTPEYLMQLSQQKSTESPKATFGHWAYLKPARCAYHSYTSDSGESKKQFIQTLTTYSGFFIFFEYFRNKKARKDRWGKDLWDELVEEKFQEFCDIITFLKMRKDSPTSQEDIKQFFSTLNNFPSFKEGEYKSFRQGLLDALTATSDTSALVNQFIIDFDNFCNANKTDETVQKYTSAIDLDFSNLCTTTLQDLLSILAFLKRSSNLAPKKYEAFFQGYTAPAEEHYRSYRHRLAIALQANPEQATQDFIQTCDKNSLALSKVYKQTLVRLLDFFDDQYKFNWDFYDKSHFKQFCYFFANLQENYDSAQTIEDWQKLLAYVKVNPVYEKQSPYQSLRKALLEAIELYPATAAKEMINSFYSSYLKKPLTPCTIKLLGPRSCLMNLFQYFTQKLKAGKLPDELTEKKFNDFCKIVDFLKKNPNADKLTLKKFFDSLSESEFTGIITSDYITARNIVRETLLNGVLPIHEVLACFDALCNSCPNYPLVKLYKSTVATLKLKQAAAVSTYTGVLFPPPPPSAIEIVESSQAISLVEFPSNSSEPPQVKFILPK